MVVRGTDATTRPHTHRRALAAVAAELLLRDPDGERLSHVGDLSGLVRQSAEHLVDSSEVWVEHLGPVYDTDGGAEPLGGDRPVSRQVVNKRRGLLALKTGSGRIVSPAFQFDETGAVADGVADIVKLFENGRISTWSVAFWLASPEPKLGGEKPIDALNRGGRQAVVSVARQWAGSLA